MRIQHNITAQNAYRQLGGNNNQVGKNLEKLSSGYRINRAGDDAAGLAISEKMRSQIKGLETAQKNSNDGISLVQTAEGALTEVHSMLNRMTELATQSANGTYDNKTDRSNLQKEVDSLVSEIDRIAESTNFNGINLLDGSLGGSGSTGNGLTGGKIVNYKGATGTMLGDAGAAGLAAADFGNQDKIMVDGTEVTVDWSKLTTDEQALLAKDWTPGTATATDTKKAAELMQKTINESIKAHNTQYGASVGEIKVTANATEGSFDFTSTQKDAKSDITLVGSTAGNSVFNLTFTGLDGTLTTAEGLGAAASTAPPAATLNAQPADYNGKFTMNVGGVPMEVDLSGAHALTATDGSDVKAKLQAAIDDALTNYDTMKGFAAGSDEALKGKIAVKLTDQGSIEFSNTTGLSIGFEDKNGEEFAKNLGISSEGKATMAGGLTLQVGDTNKDYQQVNVRVGSMSANSLGIGAINISQQGGAQSAIDSIKEAINSVSSTRGDLGAVQNRLEHTINNLGVTTENMTAAESRIRDVDMASEMMNFTKNNILTQAAQSMLAQANQLPQGVLQLLQ